MKDIFTKLIKGDESLSPVIFVHGDYQNHTVFREIRDDFIRKGHTTAVLDFPGHGLSRAKGFDLSKLLEEIVVENQLKKPAIVGNSFGGLLSIDYAKRNDVRSLTLLNSSIFDMVKIYPEVDWVSKLSEYEIIAKKLYEKQFLVDYSILNNLSDEALTALGLKTTSPIGVSNNMKFYRSFYENHNIHVNVPTLLIASKNDWLVPEENTKEWIKENKSRKLEFVQANHNVLIQNPRIILDILNKNYSFLFGDTE
jgi:pimeloyl-ACP methyl ester carboxylesterase